MEKKYKFQAITFRDHFHQNDEWVTADGYEPKPFVMTYYGWVTVDNKEMVVLSHGTHQNDGEREFDSHMHILKGNIIKRKTYKIDLI